MQTADPTGALLTPKRAGTRVELTGVRRAFEPDVVAIERVDLVAEPGEFLAVLGPSGSGKSTLLRLIAGLDRPTLGTIQVSDPQRAARDEARRAEIAFVFQDAHLLPWRNVVRNVSLPLELTGWSRGETQAMAREAIARVGLSDAQRRYPNQLSGGMRMRVSLARALVTRPRLLLLDEPFAALDEITRQRLEEQLRELWDSLGMTVIFVTHSISEAAFLAERVLVLSRRPAQIVADRKIDLPRQRSAELRTTPTFAQQTRALFEVMRQQEEA